MNSMTPIEYLEKHFTSKTYPNGNKAEFARAFGKHSQHSNRIFLEYVKIEYFIDIRDNCDVIMRRVRDGGKYMLRVRGEDKHTLKSDTLYAEYGRREK